MKRTLLLLSLFAALTTAAQTTYTHPWQGKRVAYFGDSITDPNVKAANVKYWGFLQEWLDITPYVYAISGRQWDDIPRQAAKLQEEHGDDFDAILIFIGTNDYNHGVPIGQWYTERPEQVYFGRGEQRKALVDRRRRYPCMTDSTYRGRINIALSGLKRMFPTKQIILLTPIHRAGFYNSDTNWQPTEEYQNRCGEWFSAYVESVREAADVWAVPVIDLSALCGLFPVEDAHAPYFNNADTDRLHPNDAGHERMARTLMQQLLALPCTF